MQLRDHSGPVCGSPLLARAEIDLCCASRPRRARPGPFYKKRRARRQWLSWYPPAPAGNQAGFRQAGTPSPQECDTLARSVSGMAHEIEFYVGGHVEHVKDLIQHPAVLAGRDHYRLEFVWTVTKLQNDRSHLDCVGTSPENDSDTFPHEHSYRSHLEFGAPVRGWRAG